MSYYASLSTQDIWNYRIRWSNVSNILAETWTNSKIVLRNRSMYDDDDVILVYAHKMPASAVKLCAVVDDDDLCRTATKTNYDFDMTEFSNIFDHNDGTAATNLSKIAVGESKDLLKIDFGSVDERFIFCRMRDTVSTTGYLNEILVSEDDVTYNSVITRNTSSTSTGNYSAVATFRYLIFRVTNNSGADRTGATRISSIEVYKAYSTNKDRIYQMDGMGYKTVTILTDGVDYVLAGAMRGRGLSV